MRERIDPIVTRTVTIDPGRVGPLWPARVANSCDCDYDHHRPRVWLLAQLMKANSDRELHSNIRMHAKEDGSDCSAVDGTWNRHLYTAPAGWKIVENYPSRAEVSYTDTDKDYDTFPFPLCTFYSIGETDGCDTNEQGNLDGTHVIVDFNTITIKIQKI